MMIFLPPGVKANRGPSNRRGVSLIEAMAIVSVGAILTGVVVSAMTAVFRYDKHLRAHIVERDQLQMLSQQLRSDIRQATRCQYESAEQVLTLEQDRDQTVSYHWSDHQVERIAEAGGANATRRYSVPATLQITATPMEAGQGQLMRIRLTTNNKESAADEASVSPDWNLEIQAAVGRDLWPQQHNAQGQD